jgi:hypothetical protein
VLVAVDAALLDRAGELKRELLAFSRQPRYDRAFSEVLARHGGSEVLDEHRLMMLWDYFVLEHRLRSGRTIVEQFVDAHAELSRQERELLLGWRDVVQGPFEVQRRDGPALIVVNLVDDLTYRVRSNMGTSVFRQMPRRSFLITRLVPVGEEWMLSGPTSVLRPAEREVAYRLAFEMSMRTPEAMHRDHKPEGVRDQVVLGMAVAVIGPPFLRQGVVGSLPNGLGEGRGKGQRRSPPEGQRDTATPGSPRTPDRRQRDAPKSASQ